jgi:hypothetical protein
MRVSARLYSVRIGDLFTTVLHPCTSGDHASRRRSLSLAETRELPRLAPLVGYRPLKRPCSHVRNHTRSIGHGEPYWADGSGAGDAGTRATRAAAPRYEAAISMNATGYPHVAATFPMTNAQKAPIPKAHVK